jgi:hypothetical protein
MRSCRATESTELAYCRHCYHRLALLRHALRHNRNLRLHAFFWQKKEEPTAPRPNEKFSRADLKRIKQLGPTLDDVTIKITVTNINSEGEQIVKDHIFVPPSILGETYNSVDKEPEWANMSEMPLNLFIYGLKQRNWTSPVYNSNASRWDLEIWKDNGRFMMPSYSGYRVVVRDADGPTWWVNVDRPGLDTHLSDHLAGAALGGVYKCASISWIELHYHSCFLDILRAI